MLRASSMPEAGSILTSTLGGWVGGWGEVDHSPQPQKTLPSALPADPNTLFRSNSLASKSMEQFMKVSRRRPAGPSSFLKGTPPGITWTRSLAGSRWQWAAELGSWWQVPGLSPEWQSGSCPHPALGRAWALL